MTDAGGRQRGPEEMNRSSALAQFCAGIDRINHPDEHDRHDLSGPLQRQHGRGGRRQNDIWRASDQFCRVSAIEGVVARAPADVDPRIAALHPTQFFQPVPEGRHPGLIFRIVGGAGRTPDAQATNTIYGKACAKL
jgi:hypothetical protein